MWERYLLPTTVGLAFFTISLIHAFDRQIYRLRNILIIFILANTIRLVIGSFHVAQGFTEKGFAINSLLTNIKKDYHNGATVLLVVDPVDHYEQSYSLKTYLKLNDKIDLYGYALSNNLTDEFSKKLVQGWYYYYKGRCYSDMKSSPDLIVLLDKDRISDCFHQVHLDSSDYNNVLNDNSLYALLKRKNY